MNTAIAAAFVLLVQGAPKLEPPPSPDFNKPVDYAAWLEKQVVRGQSKEDNAAPLYTGVFGPLDAEKVAEIGFNGPRTQEKPVDEIETWDPKKHPQWEAAYQKTKDKIEQFKRAAAKPYAWWGIRYGKSSPSRTLYDLELNELSMFRQLAKGATENAWRAENGKIDESAFVATQRGVLSMARQIERNPVAIAQLVSIAIRRYAFDDLLRAAELGVLSEKQRAAVLLLLAAHDEPLQPFGYAMSAERAVAFDTIQMVATKGGGKFDYDKEKGIMPGGPITSDPASAGDIIAVYLDTLVKESNAPYSPGTIERMNDAYEATRSGDKLSALIAPALSRAYELRLRCETMRRATRLVYEILVYHDKNKKWPVSLNDLPTEVSKAAKSDPFSDKPFGYRIDDGKPLLYSAAKNGKDDGGTKHDKKWSDDADDADYIFWPRQSD